MEPAMLAVQQVQSLAQRLRSPILAQLASKLLAATRYGDNPNDIFSDVRKLINDMIAKMQRATQDEMTKKAFCDSEQAKTTANRIVRVDDLKDKVTKLAGQNAAVASLTQDVADLTAQLSQLTITMTNLQKLYQSENAVQQQAMQESQDNAACLHGVIQAVRSFFALGNDVGTVTVDIQGAMTAALTGLDPNGVVQNAAAVAGAMDTGSDQTPAQQQVSLMTKLEVIQYNMARKVAGLSAQAAVLAASQGNNVRNVQDEVQGKTYLLKSKQSEMTAAKQTLQQMTTDRDNAQLQLNAIDEYIKKLAVQCQPPSETPEQMQARVAAEIKGLQDALLILQGSSAAPAAASAAGF